MRGLAATRPPLAGLAGGGITDYRSKSYTEAKKKDQPAAPAPKSPAPDAKK
jgi:hypothetical protein